MVVPMIVLLMAGLVSGLLSFTVLWPYGALTALIGAQLGATFVVLLVGSILATRGVKQKQKQSAAPTLYRIEGRT